MSDIQEQIKLAHKRAEENDTKLLKEEIKEILDNIKDNINETPKNMYKYNKIQFNLNECKLLLDYITNLQEENERLKQIIKTANMMEYFKAYDILQGVDKE